MLGLPNNDKEFMHTYVGKKVILIFEIKLH